MPVSKKQEMTEYSIPNATIYDLTPNLHISNALHNDFTKKMNGIKTQEIWRS